MEESGFLAVWESRGTHFSSSQPLFRPASSLAGHALRHEDNSPKSVHHTGMKEVKMVLVVKVEPETILH